MDGKRKKQVGLNSREEEDRGLKKKEGAGKCCLKFIKQLKDETRRESTCCRYNLC